MNHNHETLSAGRCSVETIPQMRKRHDFERARAFYGQLGGTMAQAAAELDTTTSAIDSFLRTRGLRWAAEAFEAAYPQLKEPAQQNGEKA